MVLNACMPFLASHMPSDVCFYIVACQGANLPVRFGDYSQGVQPFNVSHSIWRRREGCRRMLEQGLSGLLHGRLARAAKEAGAVYAGIALLRLIVYWAHCGGAHALIPFS